MDRGQSHGSGTYQVTQGRTHPEFHLDGLSEPDEAYRTAGPGRFRLFAHATGALLSLAVIGFGGYWGYKQIMRDVHGVPVVRALEGPMRVAPEDPGGQVADHAGLAVNDVQARGSAADPEARLTLAPAPVALSEEDQPAGQLTAQPETIDLTTPAEADDADIVAPDEGAQMARLDQEIPADDPIARAIALAEASTAGARPLSETEIAGEAAATPEAAPAEATEVASAQPVAGPGLKRSPRPAPRPVRASAPASRAANSPSIAPAVLDASAVPAGTRLVQLGAFDTADDARAAWANIAGRFDGLMSEKTQVVVEAKAGGRTFWRLRAMGFEDLAEARRFCAALVAERTDCIPVVAK